MDLSVHISNKHLWILLIAGLIGTVMGINRTIKTREHESKMLQAISALMGLLLVAVSIFLVLQSRDLTTISGYTIQIMTLLGLSLCARQLESIPATAVFVLILVAGVVFAISHWGMPEILQRPDIRKIAAIAGIAVLGAIVLLFSTIEKSVDLILAVVGLGLVVIAVSLIGLAHAMVILTSGDGRGIVKFMP